MKTFSTLTVLIFLTVLTARAQVTLPYYSGFDNTTEQNGWAEYKKAATTFSHWGIASANAFSDPKSVSHDYSPSTGITLTDNWFVSPGFSLSNGGTLDSIRYMFSGFSVPEVGDTIALYLLNGSQDPDLADSKTLLFDFRGSEYNADYVYRIKENIALPTYDGLGYIAIRYRNTDCSSKWLTAHFDNVAVSGGTVGLKERELEANDINIYPNPSSEMLTIESDADLKSVDLFNITGKHVRSLSSFELSKNLDVYGLKQGVYLLRLTTDTGTIVKRVVIE